MAINIFLYFP